MIKRERNFGPFRMVFCLAAILNLMIVPKVSATEFPGPDGFGHVAYEINSNLREVSSDETCVTLGDDQVSSDIFLPFPVFFYGISYTKIYISSNGFITFSSGQDDGYDSGDSVANRLSPNNYIAGFWEDLNPFSRWQYPICDARFGRKPGVRGRIH